MSKAYVYLYFLAALLCVCWAKSDVNSTNSRTTVVPDNYTPSEAITTLTSDSQEDSYNATDHTGDHSNDTDLRNYGNNNTLTTTGDGEEVPQSNTTTASPDDPSMTDDEISTVPAPQTSSTRVPTTVATSSTPVGTTSESGTIVGTTSESGTIGVIFLVLILLLVIALAVILYILWKKGRSYSFDLNYPANDDTPLRSMEHGGFEQTSKELAALDYVQDEKPQETNSTANGCAGETPKQATSSEQEEKEEDSFTSDISLTPPLKKVEFNLDLDLIGGESDLVDQAKPEDQQQNQNNNNFTSAGNKPLDLFTEVNLDEPQ